MPHTLIVTVDTEEEFDWSKAHSSSEWSMRHVACLPWFQELCESYGVRPTYVVDYPVATTDSAIEVLDGFLKRGACEVGTHPHPWVNPPLREEICLENTYLSNLPTELQQEKITVLTEAIRSTFGIQPTVFKAGRYGIDFEIIPFLQKLGYSVETSVVAYSSFTDDGGPDFNDYDHKPSWLSSKNGSSDRPESRMLEVPCTVGFNRKPFRFWRRVHQHLMHERYRRLHPVGILSRLGVMRKTFLSPEQAKLSHNLRLMRVLATEPDTVFNVTLHSPSVQIGNTPYVQSRADLDRFQRDLSRIFEVAVTELGAQCLTLSEYRRFLETKETV